MSDSKGKTATHVIAQGIEFNIKGSKAMGKEAFIKTWTELGKARKGKGAIGRLDPAKAWDKMFPKRDGAKSS